jgi:hypothetical protein
MHIKICICQPWENTQFDKYINYYVFIFFLFGGFIIKIYLINFLISKIKWNKRNTIT